MWQQQDWLNTIDLVAGELLERAEYCQGAVDATQLAQRLGLDVCYDHHQETRGRFKRFGHRRTLFIKPDQRSERVHWAICHEIGECFAHLVFQEMGVTPAETTAGTREQIANLLASRLLLPNNSFQRQIVQHEVDLRELKAIYPTASHELIAMRLLDLDMPRCVTIVDQGRISKRRSCHFRCEQTMLPAECDCWQTSHEECRDLVLNLDELQIQCFAIHEPHWKREIVITSPSLSETMEAIL